MNKLYLPKPQTIDQKIRSAGIILLFLLSPFFIHAQYLHSQGKKIVDGDGQEIILRGMGLGGWMLQEGYMLEMNSFANPQHQIRARIVDVIGEENTNEFYEAWLANHCTKRDIDSLASWGFNSVRLPMHYNLYTLPIEQEPVAGQNTWLDKGFAMTDSLIKWCAANQIYVILDLHAAPGGQGNDAAISDYDNTKPSLWQSDANKQKTIALWKKLAERYANEKWVGGYDLINETNWNFTAGANKNGCEETTNAPLRQLLVAITTAIREVDTHHLIFIEGNCWANNHAGIWPPWDTNIAISFHKYWNHNDQGSIQGFVNMRNQYNIPVWLGESGENSNTWFTNAISLFEKNDIGWAWWPMKKIGSVVNPLTIVKTDGYEALLNYWKGTAPKPSVATAKATLMQMAENLKIENNIYRKDVIDAMFRQVNDDSTVPFRHHVIPGVIHTTDFDLGRVNKAYFDTDTANYHVSSGTFTAWNTGYTYRNDGVDIQSNTDADPSSNKLNVGWTADKEWLQYTAHVDSSAVYQITLRYAAAAAGSKIKIQVNGNDQSPVIDLASTGSYTTYGNAVIQDVVLNKGVQKIRLYIEKGGANLGFLKFTLSKKLNEIGLKAMTASTSSDGTKLFISLNKNIDAATITKNGFTVMVNNSAATVSSVAADPQNTSGLIMTMDKIIYDNDVITISYNEDAIKSADGTLLEDFTNLPVANTLPLHQQIPGKIEAESFIINQGLQLETTTDTGGGQNIGYTNIGDYLDYRVRVTEDGEYSIELRIACNSQAGKIELQQLDANKQVLNSALADVPVTGGWQVWKTVTSKITLKAGRGYLRLKIVQPEFNLNWIQFTKTIINSTEKKARHGSLHIFPNPVQKLLHFELPESYLREDSTISIISLNGELVKHQAFTAEPDQADFYVGDLAAGIYRIELKSNGKVWSNRFIIQ